MILSSLLIQGPMSFINNKTATTLQNTVTSAIRIQLNQDHEANRMVCYNGYKTPTFQQVDYPNSVREVVNQHRAIYCG